MTVTLESVVTSIETTNDLKVASVTLLSELAEAVKKSSPPVQDSELRDELVRMLHDAIGVFRTVPEMGSFVRGMIHGSERILKVRSRNEDSSHTRLYREVLTQISDIMGARSISDVRVQVSYTVKIINALLVL